MDCKRTAENIENWLGEYLSVKSSACGFIVGISGGIDSAVVSTLCCRTGEETRVLQMPIRQKKEEMDRAHEQAMFLLKEYDAICDVVSLTGVFNEFALCLGACRDDSLAMANLRSRLRMCTLYAYATKFKYLVAGTGNKVEDYGVGFFTKYGDGGVDISPIAQLKKTQVYELAAYLGVPKSIQEAAPTDGLWDDGRTDEQQLGNTYKELEFAMDFCDQFGLKTEGDIIDLSSEIFSGNKEVLLNYITRHNLSKHKLNVPPIGPPPCG